MRALVTGGGGFLGSRLVERLGADGYEVFAARRRDYDLTSMDAAARLFEDAQPELVFTSPPRWAGSARTAPTPVVTGSRT